jgi:hypothetical protein
MAWLIPIPRSAGILKTQYFRRGRNWNRYLTTILMIRRCGHVPSAAAGFINPGEAAIVRSIAEQKANGFRTVKASGGNAGNRVYASENIG